ncbi:putative transposase [Gordonia rhizosphera NBRC 16068]|uniref:Putative transposase n=1 Tax=Gordonia rhizosphera NBRC 16068 TaxID=1108045 RepID=K6W3L9_9ACTN|nr:putative transposase [Gordonia rhizosphera NBRC 16068]
MQLEAFEGNKAETATMMPTLRAFMKAHQLDDITVVADAGMISAANKQAIESAGLSFILGEKIPTIPYLISQWHKDNPDSTPPDGLILTQRYPANAKTSYRRDQVVYYAYSADRARRSLRGIDEQIGKAEKAVAGTIPVKRNRFVSLKGADKSVNRELEAKARMLAGLKVYATNISSPTAEFVIGTYHNLWKIEQGFRMSKHDLAARPIYHRTRESIEAHLTIVFAALGRHADHRGPLGLVDQKVRHHRPPLPHHHHRGRRPHHHRRRPATRRPARSPDRDQRAALI